MVQSIKNNKPTQKSITSIQISASTRDMLKKVGRMDEDYDKVLQRIISGYVDFDESTVEQLDLIAKSYKTDKKNIIRMGSLIIIFLANSDIMKRFEHIATAKNKNVLELISEFIKFKFKK
jgi:hypothetical protein